MPWAGHQSGHTHHVDAQVAWLATQTSKTAIRQLMRIAWRTVGAIITRVWADTEKLHDQFADLTRIGIDEISYKRGHKYLTVIVDHDSEYSSGRLVWAAPGARQSHSGVVLRHIGPGTLGTDHACLGGRGSLDRPCCRGEGPNAVRCAETRSMLSNGPPTPSTTCAGPRGTTPAKRPVLACNPITPLSQQWAPLLNRNAHMCCFSHRLRAAPRNYGACNCGASPRDFTSTRG